jgi:TP901 family phage tail tape measure protein
MASPIASLLIEVGADTDSAVKSLDTLNTKVDSFATTSKAALPASAALAGAGAGIAAGFVGAISTAADFEQEMSAVKAVMTPGDAQAFGDSLSQLALVLGKDTVFSAREAAAGIEELIKAGIPAQDVLNGAASAALSLAAATGIPVAEAATIAANAMNAFGLDVSKLPGVIDQLAGVANATAADMTQLSFGLQSVGAVAHTVGLSFNDTSTALGVLINAGLQGSDAGTSLKTMLINLIPSTKKQTEEFTKLGLITAEGANQFFDATGKIKSLAEISQVLQDALKGMTEEQKLATLQTLFGTDAIRAASIISAQGAEGINKLSGEISKISASQTAAERLNNFSGSMKQLGGSVETLAITMGERLLPALKSLADFATAAVNAFLVLPEPVQTAIAVFAAVAGVTLILLGGIGLLAAGIGLLVPSFVALGAVLGAIGVGIGGIIAVIAALALPITLIVAALALLTIAWMNNWGDIQGITAGAVAAVQAGLSSLGAFLSGTVLPALASAGQFIQQNVLPFFVALADVGIARLQAAIATLVAFWNSAFLPALRATGDFFNQFVLPPFQALGTLIQNVIAPVLQGLGTILGPIGEQIANIFAGVGANAAANLQASTAQLQAEAANTRGAAGVQAGPVFNAPIIDTVNVSTEVDADRLVDQIADVFVGAESRTVPPQPAFTGGAF